MEKRELIELGQFELTGAQMRVSDPSYEPGIWCSGTVEHCRPGTWDAAAILSDEGDWGRRVAVLAVRSQIGGPAFSVLEETIDRFSSDDLPDGWSVCPFEVGVDSGQAGIFDASHYDDDSIFREKAACNYGTEWYNHCCDITLSWPCAGVLPYGVVSSSGFGDGGYPAVMHCNENGETDFICVVFIVDREENKQEIKEVPVMNKHSRLFSVVSYITWIGWLIALILRGKDDPLVRCHLNQALILNLIETVGAIISRLGGLFGVIGTVIDIAVLILFIIGIVRALRMSDQPLLASGRNDHFGLN